MARKPKEFHNHPLKLDDTFPEYRAVVQHIVDGDTFDVFIDLGLNQYAYETIRLAYVDTPEIFRPDDEAEKQAGFAAKARVEELILGKPVKLITYKDRASFGRYVAEVFYPVGEGDSPHEWISLAGTLVDEGHATET
jgi:endonuclease YncB( thermonuclease family)